MRKIEAYENETTGAIFKTPRQAAQNEFTSLMIRVARNLPAGVNINWSEVMEQLSKHLVGYPYSSSLVTLEAALAFRREHDDLLS